MAQYNIGKCPISGNTVVAFEGTDSKSAGKFGLARSKSGSYEYLDSNFVWQHVGNPLYVATSKEENEAKWQEHLKLIFSRSIVPLIIDKTPKALAMKYRCSACGGDHKSKVLADTFEEVKQLLERKCPKDGTSVVIVRLWDGDDKARKPTAPVGPIGRIGMDGCKECNGTGDYVGFTAVEPCSTCFPKKN